jgi:hypothetical protein
MTWDEIKEELKRFREADRFLARKLNLNNYTNNYFNKWFFRAGFLLMICFFAYGFYLNDYKMYNMYITCPLEKHQPCNNPMFACTDFVYGNSFISITGDCNFEIPEWAKPYCDKGWCSKRMIMPGESIGMKPNYIIAHPWAIAFAILGIVLILNHLAYEIRTRKEIKARLQK